MAILQLINVQRQANIVLDINNVYYYESDNDPTSNADVLEFIDQWISVVQPDILQIQSTQIVHLEVKALEVNGVFFATRTQGLVDGNVVGDATNPYTAYEFIYNRATRITRNGFKRFAGPVEQDVDQGGNITPGVLVNLALLGNALESPLVVSWGVCTPVIFGKATPPPPLGSGLPERVNGITGVTFVRATTQNSRKPWR
jgi:hypothetical protein